MLRAAINSLRWLLQLAIGSYSITNRCCAPPSADDGVCDIPARQPGSNAKRFDPGYDDAYSGAVNIG